MKQLAAKPAHLFCVAALQHNTKRHNSLRTRNKDVPGALIVRTKERWAATSSSKSKPCSWPPQEKGAPKSHVSDVQISWHLCFDTSLTICGSEIIMNHIVILAYLHFLASVLYNQSSNRREIQFKVENNALLWFYSCWFTCVLIFAFAPHLHVLATVNKSTQMG